MRVELAIGWTLGGKIEGSVIYTGSHDSMTIADYAEVTGRSTRTIRRWIKSGLLPARRVPLGLDFSAFRYDVHEDHMRLASDIHERQMRKLGGMSPGLWRYLIRKLGNEDRTTPMRTTGFGDVRELYLACPRCGHSFSTGRR